MPYPTVGAGDVPSLTEEQMREVDRVAIEDLGISLVQMMENAGSHLADVAIRRFAPRTVLVLAGSGGNGGGGLTAARHLANRGVSVTVALGVVDRSSLGVVPATQLAILERMGVPADQGPDPAELVIDALIGYSLRSEPRGRIAELIEWSAHQGAPILALDLPSGLGATDGRVYHPCVRAQATMTLALPKTGLLHSPEVVGDLYLADISVPASVYAAFGMHVPELFAESRILHLG